MNTTEMNTTTTTSVETFSAAFFNHIAALCKQNGIELQLSREYDAGNMPAKIVEALLTVYDMMAARKFAYRRNLRALDGSKTVDMKFRIRCIQIHDCGRCVFLWLRGKESYDFQEDLEVATARRLLTGPAVSKTKDFVTNEYFITDEIRCDIHNVVVSNKIDADE